MRLFIAINFPDPVKIEIVNSIKELMRNFPQVSWTKKENLHLTLKFLGNIKKKIQSADWQTKAQSRLEEELKEINSSIKKSIEGLKPFEMTFDKLGYFDREQLIIWWWGIKPNPTLTELAENIIKSMERMGFPKEKREFTPHITIGRGKRLPREILRSLKSAINNIPVKSSIAFQVKEVTLVESILSRKGPIYETQETFPLSG